MKKTLIQLDGISKIFRVYSNRSAQLKQLLFGWRHSYFKEFNALRGVSLQIARGESVALIGRNGSGKSTLLQLICGIVKPSTGLVEVNGRVAALLELGSGFNPEFTGRENIFLNAAIYGLKRRQIEERLAKILAFADIGEFIDQPIKTYSSGMQLRLAFAVIAHVDADILIVDEALAVGDAVFTQKCMRFIREFSQKNTLLFVSHDPSMVQSLCTRAIWLDRGVIKEDGNARDVCRHYLLSTLQDIYQNKASLRKLDGLNIEPHGGADPTSPGATTRSNVAGSSGWTTDQAKILDIQLLKETGETVEIIEGGEDVSLRITAKAMGTLERPILGFMVRDRLGQDLFGDNTLSSRQNRNELRAEPGDTLSAKFQFRMPLLQNGEYAVTVSIADGELDDNIQHEYLHEAMILVVQSDSVRWGITGIEFRDIRLEVRNTNPAVVNQQVEIRDLG